MYAYHSVGISRTIYRCLYHYYLLTTKGVKSMFDNATKLISHLKTDLIHWQNMRDNASYKDQYTFAVKALKLTEKQLELAEKGWTKDDIDRVSYIIAQKIS